MSKRALVIGCGGMDGSHLCDILLEAGYEVHGIYRKSSVDNLRRIAHCRDRVVLHRGDMVDPLSIDRVIRDVAPHEIYNEADQDHVGWSHDIAGYNYDISFGSVGRLLEIVRNYDKSIKVFQPCTAMMFGDAKECPQNETTPFRPESPYAVAKLSTYHLAQFYRRTHGMFVSTALLFNHDSPRRSEDYLLHKICASCVRIARGQQQFLSLGNLSQRVDIGYSEEFMRAAVKMLQLPEPDDFVIGTGEAHTIEEMVAYAGSWCNRHIHKYDKQPDVPVVRDTKFYRDEVSPELRADISKARSVFGFNPQFNVFRTIDLILKSYYEKSS